MWKIVHDIYCVLLSTSLISRRINSANLSTDKLKENAQIGIECYFIDLIVKYDQAAVYHKTRAFGCEPKKLNIHVLSVKFFFRYVHTFHFLLSFPTTAASLILPLLHSRLINIGASSYIFFISYFV